VQKLGLNDEGVLELMAVVDLFSGLNKLLTGLQGEVRNLNAVSINYYALYSQLQFNSQTQTLP
jgi:hypothetical protein